MKIITIFVVFATTLFIGCKSSKDLINNSCYSYHITLKEFASKLHPLGDKCYEYHFVKDSTVYMEYNEFGGKKEWMDYRLNEVLYYTDKLTDEFFDLSEREKECISNYSKTTIISLFGNPTIENEHYNYLKYYVVTYDNRCRYCSGDKNEVGGFCYFIRFDFTEQNDRCSQMMIIMGN